MSVVPFPEGMVVGTLEIETLGENLDSMTPLLAELEEDFQRVVSPDGQLLGFTNTARLPERLDARLAADPHFARLPLASRDQYRAVVQQMAHPDLLQRVSADEWIANVEQWIGQTLELGKAVVAHGRDYRAVEFIPCGDESAARCIVLEAVMLPDPETTEDARNALLQLSAAMGLPGVTFGKLEVINRVRAIMEPENMRLHRTELTRTVRCTVENAEEESEPLVLEELHTQDWTWL